MELSIENARRIRDVMLALRRKSEGKDAQIAALRRRVEDDAEKIDNMRSELAELEFFMAEKQKGLNADKLPRALAQLRQMFPGLRLVVEVADGNQ